MNATNYVSLINFYNETPPLNYTILKCYDQMDDFRLAVLFEFEDKGIVLKICKNHYTNRFRLSNMQHVMSTFRMETGLLVPNILKDFHGNYVNSCSINQQVYYVWAEEFLQGRSYRDFPDTELLGQNNLYVFHNDVLEFLAYVANKHYAFDNLAAGKSSFSYFFPGAADEMQENLHEATIIFSKRFKSLHEKFLDIKRAFLKNQSEYFSFYNQLPRSTFQGDLNKTNLILNDLGHLKGIVDFNLCGEDAILNYIFREIIENLCEDAIFYERSAPQYNFYEKRTSDFYWYSFLSNLEYISRFYKFTAKERFAANLAYRYLRPFDYRIIEKLREIDDPAQANEILNWIKFELKREIFK